MNGTQRPIIIYSASEYQSVPRTCARQTTRENFAAESPSYYYKFSLSIPLIDTVSCKLKRKFQEN